jgi:hypothetical protein
MVSGRMTVDLDPTLKRRVELVAQSHNTTVRAWIEEAVRRELEREEVGDDSIARVSVPSFARDWNSEEDAVYDELDH